MNNLTNIYRSIPQERLGVLIDLDFQEFIEIQDNIEKKWIKEKRCSCVDKLKPGRIINCEHVNNYIGEKTREIRKRIMKKTSVSLLKDLIKFQRS